MNTKTEKTIQEMESDIEVSQDISDVRWFDVPVLIIFFILFVIVALQCITRYVLNDSLARTEEIARYILIILGFVGSVSCVRKGKHIFLEFFYRYLNVKLVKIIVLLVEVLVAGFFAFLSWLCISIGMETTQNMVSINLPKSTIYYIVAIACGVATIFSIMNIISTIKSSADNIYSEKLNFND